MDACFICKRREELFTRNPFWYNGDEACHSLLGRVCDFGLQKNSVLADAVFFVGVYFFIGLVTRRFFVCENPVQIMWVGKPFSNVFYVIFGYLKKWRPLLTTSFKKYIFICISRFRLYL